MAKYPHHPAAFINAIAEEGTKAEAIEWLQKTWDELCEVRLELSRLQAQLALQKEKQG
jgi:predicted metal-dependent hydrolase